MNPLAAPLGLSQRQANAAFSPIPAIAVTAGAGSGKTRTLTGRYLGLLAAGRSLRSLVAITFTEKAAREMRNRIRQQIDAWRYQAPGGSDPAIWERAFGELDAARIGTIHSLCAAILRAHPAEANVDPLFAVLEENQAALFRARTVEDALAWAIDDPDCGRLFGPLTENALRQTVAAMLEKRLDTAAAFDALAGAPLAHWSAAVARQIERCIADPAWQQALAGLAAISSRKPDDKLELARQEVLTHWSNVERFSKSFYAPADRRSQEPLASNPDWDAIFAGLLALRKAARSTIGAKGNWEGSDLELARSAMRTLAGLYDQHIKALGDEKKPSLWTLDRQVADFLPLLHKLFEQALANYETMKAARQVLDFDDLEAGAARLLGEHEAIRRRWQADIAAVLVDEFQDTNKRQRDIIYALTGFRDPTGFRVQAGDVSRGNPSGLAHAVPKTAASREAASLFVVGDAKQSIYRFRGADVTVFRQVQEDIGRAGGLSIELDTTYRAHRPLVQALNALLAPVLGQEDDPEQPFAVPFAPLQAHRQAPKAPGCPPFVEFHLGLGDTAGEGRPVAAAALAARLHELRDQGFDWGDMALLFRASTAFGVVEDVLEAAGIPFVTVAGRGFYERSEVRDLLNILAAIADPGDDLAMAGLLRSPAFGLSDASLYLLRWGGEPDRRAASFWQALQDDAALAALEAAEVGRARRARRIVAELRNLAGRATVADLLKRLLDVTHYKAALRLAPAAGSQRAWRNVDKLLADAHRSQLVGVPEFLEYVQSLRDVAAREGEAPGEAGGAIQLMTVHQAKGLEFPVVVICDAARQSRAPSPAFLLDDELGPLLKLSAAEEDSARPYTYQLAVQRQQAMEEAEERRLLYVAATRARELLLVSGHSKVKETKSDPGKLELAGWLKWLGEAAGLHSAVLRDSLVAPQPVDLAWPDNTLSCTIYPAGQPEDWPDLTVPKAGESAPAGPAEAVDLTLVAPLPAFSPPDVADDKTQDRESDPPRRVWRVIPRARQPRGPAWVVGTLVHEALRRWRFPADSSLEAFLLPFAVESGLADPAEIAGAIGEAGRLLARFARHPLHGQLDRAERRHELPYSLLLDGQIQSGQVDLIARSAPGQPWELYDFKTDELRRGENLAAFARDKGYGEQIRTYRAALAELLGQQLAAHIVFLDAAGQVEILSL